MGKEVKEDVFAEDDDFNFGNNKSDKKTEGEVTQKSEEGSSDTDDDNKGSSEESAGNDVEKEGEEKKEEKEGKEGKEGEGDKKEDNDFDLFLDDDKKTSDDKKVSFKKLASGFDIELDNDDEQEFTTKIKDKIDKSRQEFNLDDYPDDAKKIINHLKNNGGKLEDFFNNKNIAALQGVINLPAEDKVRQVRINELRGAGIAADKAREQADAEIEELSQRELKNMADKIDDDANKLISQEITSIVGDRKAAAEKERQKAIERTKEEVKVLTRHIESQKEFLGIPLTDKAKQSILRDVESGAFDDIANKAPASSKFAAYMLAKFGDRINDHLKKYGSSQNRKGYNAATDKHLSALHQTKDSAKQQGTGHQKSNQGAKSKFSGFAGAFDDSDD